MSRKRYNAARAKLDRAATVLTPVDQIEGYAIIIRAIHSRGPAQQEALAELERRGLWLAPEQKQQAGLTPGHPDTAQRDCEVQEQEEADAKNR